MMVLGFNGRYANKKLNGGSFPSYAIGEYNMKVVDGSKLNGYDTDFFTMNGFAGEITYYFKKKNTIISCRYEQFDLNDLVDGKSQRIYGSLAYQIDGFNSMIKFQYWHILSEEENDPLKWTNQFRLGWCFLFK